MHRALDVVLAGAGLTLSSPLLALAAVAVRLEDGGPVLYRQTRVGKDGSDFELLKLRTMVVGAERIGAGWAVDRGDAGSRRSGACSAGSRSTSCRSSGTSSAATCRSSGRGRRSATRSSSTTSVSAAGST